MTLADGSHEDALLAGHVLIATPWPTSSFTPAMTNQDSVVYELARRSDM